MQQVLLIAVGGSIGCVARFGISSMTSNAASGAFPWGTFAVNITGSFLIGVFAELFETAIVPSGWRSFVTIGFLGGYTTFSTFTLETLNLLRDGELRFALLNLLGSNLLGIACVALGLYATRIALRLVIQG
jgi:CrcB protein